MTAGEGGVHRGDLTGLSPGWWHLLVPWWGYALQLAGHCGTGVTLWVAVYGIAVYGIACGVCGVCGNDKMQDCGRHMCHVTLLSHTAL